VFLYCLWTAKDRFGMRSDGLLGCRMMYSKSL
jgi:hypothetical protein